MIKLSRLTQILFSLLGLLAVLSCTASAADQPQIRVGVLWFEDSGMARRVFEGFKTRMAEIDSEVEIEYRGDLPSRDEAAKLYETWQETKDGILFLRSAGARFLAEHPPRIPAFIGAANHPSALGVIKNIDKPEGKITGVTYYVPIKWQLQIFHKLVPTAKTVGLLVMEGHPSSALEQEATKEACRAMGIGYKDTVCKDIHALHDAVLDLAPKVDLLILGNQNLLIDNGRLVAMHAGRDTPVVSYSERPVEDGHAVAGLVPDDEKLGRMLAESVAAVLIEKRAVQDVPVKMDPEPRLLLCMPKVKYWNISPPLSIMRMATRIQKKASPLAPDSTPEEAE